MGFFEALRNIWKSHFEGSDIVADTGNPDDEANDIPTAPRKEPVEVDLR